MEQRNVMGFCELPINRAPQMIQCAETTFYYIPLLERMDYSNTDPADADNINLIRHKP